ncbi:protein takeout-like [Schistocerca piceifrons]|uniref:protein takeout-like n=1 Tax=Schistocerca piceifrons TaxID=274613 RepID=UPI001F5F2FB4|nr:protein takeout-like [Schistocerca piceifrons]
MAASAAACRLPPLLLLALVITVVAPASALQLPEYIKACSRNDPDLNACAYKNALEAIPNLIKGDRQYNVPPLNPLKVTEIKVSGGEGSVGLDITFSDVSFHGFTEAVVKETNFDLANNKAEIKASVPVGQLLGKYEVDGKVLLLPIKGSGEANITLTDLDVDITVQWELETKDDGKEYIKPVDSDIKYEMSRAYMYLDNLFDGDKLLGDNTNQFLNENWQEVVKEIGPALAEALSQVVTLVLSGIAGLVPYDEVFPEAV